MFSYVQEPTAMEIEQWAAEPPVRRHYESEGHMLADQARDEAAQDAGFTGWQGEMKAHREYQEKLRARYSLLKNHQPWVNPADDIPF